MSDTLSDVLPGLSRRAASPTRRRTRRLLWLSALVLCVGSLVAWQIMVRHRAALAVPYETASVTRGPLAISITAVGTLEPLHSVAVGSELSGIVREVLVDINDPVAKGQPLARLDAAILRAQARLAASQVAAAEAAVEQATVAFETRGRELERARTAGSARPAADLDQAESAVLEAKAALRAARARVEEARATRASADTNLAKSVIVSPIDGIVLERNVEPGQAVVSAFQAATLFQVAEDLEHMKVDVDVDEADVGRVTPGLSADFTVAAWPDRLFDATVTRVHQAPLSGVAVVTYRAELEVQNPERLLYPGMTATVRIESKRLDDALLVPNAALRFSPKDQILPPPEARDGRRRVRVWELTGGELSPIEVIPLATDGTHTAVDEGVLAVGTELAVQKPEAKKTRAAGPPHP